MNLSRLISPTFLLALSALFSRLLGVFRDHLLAKTFGASNGEGIYNLDVYYAAFRIPDLLYNLLIFGAISSAFIPLFIQYKKENRLQEAWVFASNMLHLMLILIFIFSVIAFLLAPFLAPFIAPGFDHEALKLVTQLMRILLISPILFTFTAIFISLQDSFKTFFFRSIGPLFYNLGIILGILLLSKNYGVIGVTWGVIFGGLLQLLIQLPALRQIGFKHIWILDKNRQDVQQAIRLILPRILALSLGQIALFLNTIVASFLSIGSITIFYLADNLQSLPLGMIGISFAITSFATFSELAIEKKSSFFAKEIQTVMQKILFFIVPATFGLFLLRHEIIDLILVNGQFTSKDGLVTASTFGFFLISLFAQALIPVLTRGFYAYQKTKIPLLAALVGTIISLFLSYSLAFPFNWGIKGMALGFSMGMIVNASILYLLMSKHCKRPLLNRLAIFKMFFSASVMFSFLWFIKNQITYQGEFWYKLLYLLLFSAAGFVIYFILSKLMNIEERKMIRENE